MDKKKCEPCQGTGKRDIYKGPKKTGKTWTCGYCQGTGYTK